DMTPHSGPPARARRGPDVTTQIFIGLVLGIVVGYLWPSFGVAIKPLADAFLRMIKMIIAPLLFATLVIGIAGTGDLKAMGRIGVKAIVYFEVATTIALFLGRSEEHTSELQSRFDLVCRLLLEKKKRKKKTKITHLVSMDTM